MDRRKRQMQHVRSWRSNASVQVRSANAIHASGLYPFHAAAVGEGHARGGCRFETAEIRPEFVERFRQYGWADGVDAQPARQFYRRGANEACDRRIDCRRIGAVAHRFDIEDAASQREGASVSDEWMRRKHDLDLPHELVVETDPELFRRRLRERAEMQSARRSDDRVHLADFGEQSADAPAVEDIDAMRSARLTGFDHFMPLRQLGHDRFADRTVGADYENLHLAIPWLNEFSPALPYLAASAV